MLRTILRAARDSGYDVEAVFPDEIRDRRWLRDLDRDELPFRFIGTSDISKMTREIDQIAGDDRCIFHTHFSRFDLACAAHARRHPDNVVFWHVHSQLKPGAIAWARNAVRFTAMARGVEEIMCVAPDLPRAVRRRLAPPNRVTFVPNAIDTARFAPAPEGIRETVRAKVGVKGDAPLLLHFGWDWERKGGDLFLEAAARIPEAVAVTVGGGESAQRAASELGISGRVRVLEPTEKVEELYAAADVVVMPSRAEGMPFTMAEALSCGRPVVGSDIPGHRWICEHVRAGRLTPPDGEEIAREVSDVLAWNPRVRAANAAAARSWVQSEMDIEVWAARLLERYQRTAERR